MRELTAEDRQLLFRQASTAYKAAHQEQQEAGINAFIPTASPVETSSLEHRLLELRGGFPGLWLLVGP